MAPGTNTGSATPIQMGEMPGEPEDEPAEDGEAEDGEDAGDVPAALGNEEALRTKV